MSPINPEDYEELYGSADYRRGAGGRKRKRQEGGQKGQSVQATRREQKKKRLLDERQEALKIIKAQVETVAGEDEENPDLVALLRYEKWLRRVMSGGEIIGKDELKIGHFTSGGPGGQGRQHRQSARLVVHTPTLFWAEAAKSRGGHDNVVLATEKLVPILEKHREDWLTALSNEHDIPATIRRIIHHSFGVVP